MARKKTTSQRPAARSASAAAKKPQDTLRTYRAKRHFDRSPEPTGAAAAGKGSARGKQKKPAKLIFCVQKHLASNLHYDFRLEYRGVLLSWAVPKGPSLRPEEKRLAMQVEDHPLEYADFEGVIPEGYGAGVVMVWDKGTWDPQVPDVAAALEKGELKFTLEGYKLKGSWVLVRTRGRGRRGPGGEPDADAAAGRQWLLIKHRDQWSGALDITRFAPLSVKSNTDLPEILAQQTPEQWQSHRGQGTKAGTALRALIRQAAALQAQSRKRKNPAPGRGKPRKKPAPRAA